MIGGMRIDWIRSGRVGMTVVFFWLGLAIAAQAQTFTSTAAGLWTTGSNWGGTAPPLSGQSYGSVTVQNNMNTGANYTVGSFVLNVQAGSTLTVNGNLTLSNSGGTINVYGTLVVTGTLSSSSNFNIFPGGTVQVAGSTYVYNNNAFIVGTGTAPPPNANFVAESDVNFSSGGGGMTVNQNGRVVVYGNVNSTSGGTVLQVNNGGQMYVNGNISMTGNGDNINSNNTSPYGLFVNGTTTVNTAQGGTASNYIGTKSSMQTTDPGFYAWVKAQPNSPLPVTLLFFSIESVAASGITLVWETATELNFNYFVIEKSVDGHLFSSIGQVDGHGTSQTLHRYVFYDDNPLIGDNYYRLKAVDFDGVEEIFQVVVGQYQSVRTAAIYPNPLSDGPLHVDLNFEGTDTTVTLTDVNGIVRAVSSFPGQSQLSFPVVVPPGVYIVSVVNGNFRQVSRLLVR